MSSTGGSEQDESDGGFERDEMADSEDGGGLSDMSGDFERDVLMDSEDEREMVATPPIEVEVDYAAFLKSLNDEGSGNALDWLFDENDDDYIYGTNFEGAVTKHHGVVEEDDEDDPWEKRGDRAVNVSAEELTDLVKKGEAARKTRKYGKESSLHGPHRLHDSVDTWMEQFQCQMDSHVQLLCQGYVRSLQHQSDENRLTAMALRCLMMDLHSRQAREMTLKEKWPSPVEVESDGRLLTISQRSCFAGSIAISLVPALIEYVEASTGVGKTVLGPEQAKSALALFQSLFSVSLFPKQQRAAEEPSTEVRESLCASEYLSVTPVVAWSPQEDQLLATAVKSLGEEGVMQNHSQFFASRSVQDVTERMRFLTSRRAPNNSVKEVHLARQRPFEAGEWSLLERGVQIFGSGSQSWPQIRERYLPNRDAQLLEKLWRTRIGKRESRARQRDKNRAKAKAAGEKVGGARVQ